MNRKMKKTRIPGNSGKNNELKKIDSIYDYELYDSSHKGYLNNDIFPDA